jgi:adenylate kinase
VPHVTIGELIAAAMKQTNAFGEELRNKIEELKDLQIAEYEKTRNKKKDPELDRATLKPRLSEEYLYKILKMHMETAACKNKGYILDGYPRTLADAKAIFTTEAPDSQEDPFPGHVLNQEVLPQYVILLQGDDAMLKQRVKEMPAEKAANTHFTEAHMERRLKVYRDTGDVAEFLSKALPEDAIKTMNAFGEGDILQELQAFIEVNGKPCCLNLITENDTRFLKKLEEEPTEAEDDELAAIVRVEEEANQVREEQKKEKAAKDAEEEEKRRVKEAADLAKYELIKQQERDLLDTRS